MSFWSTVANVSTGGLYGTVKGWANGDTTFGAGLLNLGTGGLYGTGDSPLGAPTNNNTPPAPPAAPAQPDYSAVLLIQSNNSKDTAIAQMHSQEFTLQQTAMDRELKQKADLELGLEKFDTKLQMGQMEYRQSMKVEENRHIEKIAANAKSYGGLTRSSVGPDLAPPQGGIGNSWEKF